MKNLLLISLIFIGFIIPAILESQTRYPTNYFRSPVDFPILLAGGFGDVRQNHFHSGIDIRTGGEEGKPVYAVATGMFQGSIFHQRDLGKHFILHIQMDTLPYMDI